MSDRNRKPGNKIGREDSAGQNPFWPGEDAQQPGTIETDKEKTTIPVVDSVQDKTKNQTNE
jgi:hypothetical protein